MRLPHAASPAERGQLPGPDPAGMTPVLPPLPSEQDATERARAKEQRAADQKQAQAEEFNREHTRLRIELSNAQQARDRVFEAAEDLSTIEAASAAVEVHMKRSAATTLVQKAQAALDGHKQVNPYR